jgi:hypothetical protein
LDSFVGSSPEQLMVVTQENGALMPSTDMDYFSICGEGDLPWKKLIGVLAVTELSFFTPPPGVNFA